MYSFGFHWLFKDRFNERDSNIDDVGKIGYSIKKFYTLFYVVNKLVYSLMMPIGFLAKYCV